MYKLACWLKPISHLETNAASFTKSFLILLPQIAYPPLFVVASAALVASSLEVCLVGLALAMTNNKLQEEGVEKTNHDYGPGLYFCVIRLSPYLEKKGVTLSKNKETFKIGNKAVNIWPYSRKQRYLLLYR